MNGAIYALPYDVLKDFEPISLISSNPAMIVAKKAMPADDLKGLIAWLKANPDKIEEIVPARHSLVGRRAATGLMQQRIADLAISVLGCCELHSQKQAQLKVAAFQPQPSGYQN